MRDPVEDAKRALRAELRERRRIRTTTEREHAEAGLTAQLCTLAGSLGIRSLAAYLSTPTEPSTRGFLRWADARGLRVLLPVSRADGLLDWAPYDGGAEAADEIGMPAPTTELLSPLSVNAVDLILVPAACVDGTGMRMGWGRGYFDKLVGSMASRPPVYAVVFDDEIIDQVPRERHDVAVDGAVTPSRIVTF